MDGVFILLFVVYILYIGLTRSFLSLQYFTVLINTFEAGGSTSSLTSVSLVLDYFAYDPRRSQDVRKPTPPTPTPTL